MSINDEVINYTIGSGKENKFLRLERSCWYNVVQLNLETYKNISVSKRGTKRYVPSSITHNFITLYGKCFNKSSTRTWVFYYDVIQNNTATVIRNFGEKRQHFYEKTQNILSLWFSLPKVPTPNWPKHLGSLYISLFYPYWQNGSR